MRGRNAQIVIEADATDPPRPPTPSRHAGDRPPRNRCRDRRAHRAGGECRGGADVVVHRLYNPEGVTTYNIVPGLIGVILTLTTTLMTALALTREIERGTMESLLAMPLRPLEIMIGKILPYIGLGFVQVVVILTAAYALFSVPLEGSLCFCSSPCSSSSPPT